MKMFEKIRAVWEKIVTLWEMFFPFPPLRRVRLFKGEDGDYVISAATRVGWIITSIKSNSEVFRIANTLLHRGEEIIRNAPPECLIKFAVEDKKRDDEGIIIAAAAGAAAAVSVG